MANATRIETARPEDLAVVVSMLDQAGLPPDGVDALGDRLWLARDDRGVLGCVGLESYGGDALLRSLCVVPEGRGRGIGGLLVHHVLEQARRLGVGGIYLLTTTAAGYFPRHGFVVIERDVVPAAVRSSSEFTSLCPASAVAMRLEVAA